MKFMARSYQLKQRGERQERTRQKIIKAAIDLHQAKGLAATSINDIAEQAKVGRVTVYRHFPDAAALVGACSGQYFQIHPLPDLEPWRSVQDPTARLRRGLRETYAYHRATEAMMIRIHAEAWSHPVMTPYHTHWQRAADVIAAAWPATGRRGALLNAAFTLALGFESWRTLVRVRGLNDDQAIKLMLRLTCDCPPNSG
ncbi:MAG: TetR/AcrR family transcriptional regulator [Alphaproteobacteria bacterium]|nr:TetR/AcrR family transcriptional regulator [Alphaproteobacteria bacterium]